MKAAIKLCVASLLLSACATTQTSDQIQDALASNEPKTLEATEQDAAPSNISPDTAVSEPAFISSAPLGTESPPISAIRLLSPKPRVRQLGTRETLAEAFPTERLSANGWTHSLSTTIARPASPEIIAPLASLIIAAPNSPTIATTIPSAPTTDLFETTIDAARGAQEAENFGEISIESSSMEPATIENPFFSRSPIFLAAAPSIPPIDQPAIASDMIADRTAAAPAAAPAASRRPFRRDRRTPDAASERRY